MKSTLSSETETAARLRRAVTQMNRRLRYSSLSGISPARASMLAVINKLTNPSLGDLANAEQVQPPTVTRMVKDMERDGLIATSVDANDRRCIRVKLTTAGKRELSTIRQRKTEFLERKLAELSDEEQVRAEELVTLLEHLLDTE